MNTDGSNKNHFYRSSAEVYFWNFRNSILISAKLALAFREISKAAMTTLPNKKVVEIAKAAAKANNISFTSVTTASALDSTGSEAIEIKIVLTPGSSDKIMGERSARTVSDVIKGLADAGEVRFPIVRYEERIATSKS